MAQNLISATFSTDDSAEVLQYFASAKAKLNFLLSMQTDDITGVFKVGNAYLPFIETAFQAAAAHPEILPGIFNKDEFFRDYELLKTLRPIFNQANELAESIQKTFMAVGSDSLVAALEVYAAVKQNKDKVPGLNVTADEMAVFFKKSKAKTVTETK